MVYAQHGVYGIYVNSITGHSLNFGYSHHWQNSELGGGLIVNLSNKTSNNSIYYKNLDPNGVSQAFGVQLFYNYYIFRKLEFVEPFITVDCQYSFAETSSYLDANTEATHFGPFHWIENMVGIGVRIPIINQLCFTSKAGFGGMFILGNEEMLLKEQPEWEFGGSVQVGFTFLWN